MVQLPMSKFLCHCVCTQKVALDITENKKTMTVLLLNFAMKKIKELQSLIHHKRKHSAELSYGYSLTRPFNWATIFVPVGAQEQNRIID